MEPVKFTPEDSIAVIEQSLRQSTRQKTGASNYYIIWGTVLFLYFMGYYICFQFRNESARSIANALPSLFCIGGLFSFFQSRRDDRRETMVPLNEQIYAYGWMGASIALGAVCVGNLSNFLEVFCSGVLLIFGMINFVIGGVTRFKPLLIGGAISMLLSH